MSLRIELTAIDRHFADFICRQAGNGVRSLVALASNAVGNGHVCLDLAEVASREVIVDGRQECFPSMDELRTMLACLPATGKPGEYKPLILDSADRLYLHRYWQYEQDLATVLLTKLGASTGDIDKELLRKAMERNFPGKSGDNIDWQRVAALAALQKKFCVISGGPGTGKTSTVVKIIALLSELAGNGSLRIALAAPTGKAANRLKESLAAARESILCPEEIKRLIPTDVTTIHRLLGPLKGSVRFRHNVDNRLPFDLVIVDEASMVALPLLSKLAVALEENARFIILGDKDQLASVEAGAVLGDICRNHVMTFSNDFTDLVATVTGDKLPATKPEHMVPLTDSLIFLQKNYRFTGTAGIGILSKAVNAGNAEEALTVMTSGEYQEMTWRDIMGPDSVRKELSDLVLEGYGDYLHARSPKECLQRFEQFRILCAIRQGPYGVAVINGLVEEILTEHGLVEAHKRWYHGRPVMITRNDYNLRLFNGDIGIVMADRDSDGELRVFFSSEDGSVKKIAPVRLPDHETVFAMTVHKSQGSEFDRILFLLPNRDSEILTRELIYTGITRAKESVEMWGDKTIFCKGISRKISRNSGLSDVLWR